ncbi:MAG: class I SAM-dependent methyltransferase [Candidatus Eremiobacteraeota bacterium]|nr:class I SAM-dependent methyltransferase [Candidatus Eremiobacteraeota bacterium]
MTPDLEALQRSPHPLLVEVEQRAAADGVASISRPMGRFLSTVVTAMQANRILEVGTGYGYSTLWMAFAQPPAGRIWTVEAEAFRAGVALDFFRRAAEDDYIEVFTTPAYDLLENFPQRNLDIVFVAGDSARYDEYLDLVVPMLKLSGLAIFNDCLRDDRFTRRFLAHPSLDATLLPIGAGAAVGARRR